MSKTRLFRQKSLSNKGKNKLLGKQESQIEFLQSALMHIIKDRGSNLTPGRFTLIIQKELGDDAVKPTDKFLFEVKQDSIWFIVEEGEKPKVEDSPIIIDPGSTIITK